MKKFVGLLAVLALSVVVAGCGDRGSDASGGTGGGSTTAPADTAVAVAARATGET